MIWNLVLWAAVAFLVVTILFRLLSSRQSQPASEATESEASPVSRILGRGWIAPAVAALVALVAVGFIYAPKSNVRDWTESEAVEVEHFVEAISLYQNASTLSQKRGIRRGDWESVNALMQASLSEAEQISDSTLRKIDPELPAQFQEKFMPGLRIGAYGLRYYAQPPQKGKDTVEHHRDDSLQQSRGLLEEWNSWFLAHKAELMSQFE